MSNHHRFKRARRTGAAFAVGLGVLAVPAVAQAQVNLATTEPFVVLGGAAVTNTGPSVLNGDLGVSPGTSLVGFGLPAVVNGATHNNNAVAANAQDDLTTAYTVAAGQPVPPGNVLTGTNLGNRTLTAGAYRYSTSAGLTGALTLDAEGDPNAQFIFEIGSTLTTAGASSVRLINGASRLQRLLAGGKLGDAGHDHGLPGQPDGPHEHLAQQRGDRDRANARPQRLGHPHQQRPQRPSMRHHEHAGRR